MNDPQFKDFEFCVHQDDVEATWEDSTGMEQGQTIPISKLDYWGSRNTDLYKGESEEVLGSDHTGEPKYVTSKWDYDSFHQLPSEWQIELITQYLKKKNGNS